MKNLNGKTSRKNPQLRMLERERIQDLQTEIDAQNAKKIKNKALIEKLEEAKAQNELILMRLEDKEVILH